MKIHSLDSEYKRVQFFKEKDSFIEVKQYVNGTKNINKRHKRQFSLITCEYDWSISIKKILNGLFIIDF